MIVMIVVLVIAVLLLACALVWLMYQNVLLTKRVRMLEFQVSQQIAADAKIAAALSEAVALKKNVAELDAVVSSATGAVTKIAAQQAELNDDVELREARKGKLRTVQLHQSVGWN